MKKLKHFKILSKALLSLVAILVMSSMIPALAVQATTSSIPLAANATVVVYADSLSAGWVDWSWNTTRSLSNRTPVQSGNRSIAVSINQAWGAFYLHSNAAPKTAGYSHLEFYIHGGTSGAQRINVIVNSNTSKPVLVTTIANAWKKVSIALSSLGSPASLVDLYLQDAAGTAQPKFYIDYLVLVDNGTVVATPTKTPVPGVTKTVAPTVTSVPGATKTATPVPATTQTPISTGHFYTLAPGSALPSDSACAAAVKLKPENKRMNNTYNATAGSQKLAADFFGGGDDPKANTVLGPRVTGNYTGTTDQILQWAACKWGFDEDIVRAQAAKESWWQQTAKGDWTSTASICAPGHGLGVDGTSGQCPESWGILQNRYTYEQSAWPGIYTSTAFNADTAYAEMRACYEGYEWWLNSVDRGSTYAAGDVWGCVGRWYAGRWHTAPAETYISSVKNLLNTRVWETAGFQEP